jgi:hypothetical protein
MHVEKLFNPPSEVEGSPIQSGRSPDLRFIEIGLPSQDLVPVAQAECQSLGAYSYGVVTELHRLPEHQMIER